MDDTFIDRNLEKLKAQRSRHWKVQAEERKAYWIRRDFGIHAAKDWWEASAEEQQAEGGDAEEQINIKKKNGSCPYNITI